MINPPAGYLDVLGILSDGVEINTDLDGSYDLIQAFFTHFQELENQIEGIISALADEGILWISYPKLSAKKDSDLNRDILREKLAGKGLKAVSLISIDEIWSALRF